MAVQDPPAPVPTPDAAEAPLLGPLGQLRISTLVADRKRAQHKPAAARKPTRKNHKQDKIRSKQTTHAADFLFDLQLPQQEEPAEPLAEESLDARGLKLAAHFLNSARSLSHRYNVVDAIQGSDAAVFDPNATQRAQHIHVSRATRSRAAVVKAWFELKQQWIERELEPDDAEHEPHPGVAGVYNPLQIIRNRQVRIKFHEQPPATLFQNLPLACNAFSSKNVPGQKMRRMTWGVDLHEFVNDYTWRQRRWSEFVNPQGELWFPQSPAPGSLISSEQNSCSQSTPVQPKRLHDRLWNESETESDRRYDSDVNVNFVPIKATRKDNGLRQKFKDKAKRRLYGSSNSSDLEVVDTTKPARSFDALPKFRTSRMLHGLPKDEDAVYQFSLNASEEQQSQTPEKEPEVPLININNASQDFSVPRLSVTDVESNGMEASKAMDAMDLEDDDIPEEVDPSIKNVNFNRVHIPLEQPTENGTKLGAPVTEQYYFEQQMLAELGRKGSYLESVIFLNSNYLNSIHPRIVDSIKSCTDRIVNNDLNRVLHTVVKLNDNHLPAQEALYSSFLTETRGLIHVANDNCAVRIDNLLSATDRAYGEINTSLLMDLRKTNEQLDRLNQLLFGGPANSLQNRENAIFSDGGNYRALYFLLENSIVISLRVVWIVVNIANIFVQILRIIWRMLTFIF